MLFAAIIAPLPDGRFRAIVPDLPDLTLEADSIAALESSLPAAIERHLDVDGRRFTPKSRARVIFVEAFRKPYLHLRDRRAPPLTEPDLEKLETALSALLECRGLRSDLLNEIFGARREVLDALRKVRPPSNVVRIRSRPLTGLSWRIDLRDFLKDP